MNIIGLHGFSYNSKIALHNTGVAIIKNGEILAAVDEERYTRRKNDGSFPILSLKDSFEIAGITPNEIDFVAMPDFNPTKQLQLVTKYVLKTFKETGYLMNRYWLKTLLRTIHLKRKFPECLESKKKFYIHHHLAHSASAYYTSPWNKATIVTLDGMGDYSIAGIIAKGENGKINLIKELNGFYSPGIFYAMITDYLGFIAGRHEGKVTGLAAYGDSKNLMANFDDIFTFDVNTLDFYSRIIPYEIEHYSFKYGKNDKLKLITKIFKDYKKEDIAAFAQYKLEQEVKKYICSAVKLTGIKKMVLAGGVFANVKLNQKLRELNCVDDIYIFPAMSDSGLSVGAALYLYYHILGKQFIPKQLHDVFLGREYSNNLIEKILLSKNIIFSKTESIEKEIARYLAEGKTVAHFYGRMEYGPRALGNRSILVQATNPEINKILNKKLKRTEFMPFAPIILKEFASEYLFDWKETDIPSRFMTITYNTKPLLSAKAPAVVHIDKTARPQIVDRSQKRLYNILREYYKLTGIPVLINTSFNLHEEPIVNKPEEAISILNKNVVDVLVLNNYIIKI